MTAKTIIALLLVLLSCRPPGTVDAATTGADEIPTTREEAVDVAWSDWWQGVSQEWRTFMTELGAFADEEESA